MKEQVQADVIITSSKQDERILKILQGQGTLHVFWCTIVQHDDVILIVLLLLMILTYNMYFFEFVPFDWFPLCKLKWNWPGHVARRTDNHWTTCITFWMPHGHTRNGGRPRMRLRDDLDSFGKHSGTMSRKTWSIGDQWGRPTSNNGHSTAETDRCVTYIF